MNNDADKIKNAMAQQPNESTSFYFQRLFREAASGNSIYIPLYRWRELRPQIKNAALQRLRYLIGGRES